MKFLKSVCCCTLLLADCPSWALADEQRAPAVDANSEVRISPATTAADGICMHLVRSPFQAGETKIRVLQPGTRKPEERFPVLYLLPVEPGDQSQYGNPLTEIVRLKLHERHRIICVFPTLTRMPWYADHPRDRLIRQESYLLRVVLPTIDREYPVQQNSAGRWLLGFSKGGWGAISLLLRHPETFDRAAGWDVPYTLPYPDRYQMLDIFGTQENFDRHRIPLLAKSQAERLRRDTRLLLLGHNLFLEHQQSFHQQLDALKVPHVYREGPRREHRWDSGWLPDAITLLTGLPRHEPPAETQPGLPRPR